MMQQLTIEDAAKLTRRSPFPAISLYLSGQKGGKDDGFAGEVAKLGLLRKIEARLQRIYSDKETLNKFIEPLRRAIHAFNPRKGGIGIFHSQDFTGIVNLPVQTESLAVTADSFHIKPLLRARHLSQAYYLLVLRPQKATLLRVRGTNQVILDEIPLTRTRAALRAAGNRAIRAYRRVAGLEPLDQSISDTPQRNQVVRAPDLARTLQNTMELHYQFEPLPIMLAGSHNLIHIAAEALESMDVVPTHWYRNLANAPNNKVAEQVASVMESHFALQDAMCAKRYDRARMQGMGVSGLPGIAREVVRGNLTELMIASDRNVWGRLDRLSGKVTVSDALSEALLQDDLLDDLAEVALAKGVKVTVVPIRQMPDQMPVAAILKPRFRPEPPMRAWAPAPVYAS